MQYLIYDALRNDDCPLSIHIVCTLLISVIPIFLLFRRKCFLWWKLHIKHWCIDAFISFFDVDSTQLILSSTILKIWDENLISSMMIKSNLYTKNSWKWFIIFNGINRNCNNIWIITKLMLYQNLIRNKLDGKLTAETAITLNSKQHTRV